MANNPSNESTLIWRYKMRAGTNCLAMSADGQYIAAGSFDYYINLFNSEGRLLWKYQTNDSVNGIAMSADAQYIVAGSGDTNVYLFSTDGNLLWKYQVGYVQNVAISADGQYIAAGSFDGNVYLFNNNGILLWKYYVGYGQNVAISTDGKYVSAVSEGHNVYLFNNDGILLWKSSVEYLETFVMSSDGQYIAIGSRDLNVYLLDHGGDLLWNYRINDSVHNIAISADGHYIAAGSFNSIYNGNNIYFFSREGGFLRKYQTNDSVNDLAISDDGRYIAAGSADDQEGRPMVNPYHYYIYLFSNEGTLLWKNEASWIIYHVAISSNGDYVAGGSADGNLYYIKNSGIGFGIPESTPYITPDVPKMLTTIPTPTSDGRESNLTLPISKISTTKPTPKSNGEGSNLTLPTIIIIFLFSIGVIFGIYQIVNNRKKKKAFKEKPARVQKPDSIGARRSFVDQVSPQSSLPEKHPQWLLNKYTESELIGKSVFAQVFKAKRFDGKIVAVKVFVSIDDKTGKSFSAALNEWKNLNHNNIVKVYDVNIMPIPYIEMEFCDSSLKEIKKPIKSEVAAWIIFIICSGLKFAHLRKTIHRNLKPQNILLKNGICKISDWGLSPFISESKSINSTSCTHYNLAPEQIENRIVDERTDIWQLGVIFYEMVTGELPFAGDSMDDFVEKIARTKPKFPFQIDPETKKIENIILNCLQKDPLRRYQSVTDLQKDLAIFLQIDYSESERQSNHARNNRWSALLYSQLLLKNLESGNIPEAHKCAIDLINYTDGNVNELVQEFSEQLCSRMENDITEIPDELIKKAEFILHQVTGELRNT